MKLLLLILLMSVTLLCACGPDAASPEHSSSAGGARTAADDVIRGRQVVKLAVIARSKEWLPMVIAGFNNSSVNYYLEADYYYVGGMFDQEVTPEFDEAVTRFNIDITARNNYDIVLLSSWMQTGSYISKGLFADLNEFMDADPDFDRADYLPELFTALDRKGKIYEIPPLFFMNVILAKTADVGTDTHWTLDEFAAFIESRPDVRYIFGNLSKKDFINRVTQYMFVNPGAGEITFDRDGFKKILQIAERFPSEIPPDYNIGNNPLMYSITAYDFLNAAMSGDLLFGEESTMKGWPSSTDSGMLLAVDDYFSIFKSAENADGAWTFLKYALNHAEHQYKFRLPVNISLLEKAADKYLTADYTGFDFYIGSQAEVDRIMALYKSASTIDRENIYIRSIIDEEIGSYLNGLKPADTVIDIIENRIAIYLAEQE